MRNEPLTLTTATLCCQECSASWLDPAERWQMVVLHEDEPETLLYCPACSVREFS